MNPNEQASTGFQSRVARRRNNRITEMLAGNVGSEIRNKYQSWRYYKLPFEGNHFLNIAFYYGYQWTIYNVASGELSEVTNTAGSLRLTSNQIQPRIRNLHSKMTKNKPITEVIPDGWQAKQIHSARVSHALLEYFREIHNEMELDDETIHWTLCAGDAFRKVGFDPDEGQLETLQGLEQFQQEYSEQTPPEGGPTAAESGFSFGEDKVSFRTGEIFDDVVTPFEIYIPEYALNFANANEIMHVKILPIDTVRERWGRKGKKVSPSMNMYMANQFSHRLMGMANPEVGNSSAISRALAHQKQELCYVFELWKKPTKKRPKGSVTIAAGDGFTVLYDEDNPYYDAFMDVQPLRKFGGLPFIHFQGIFAPGRFWNISPIEPMRPLQVEYNKTISDMVQNRATIGRNKIIAPKTANIDSEEIANMHGQYLEYSGIKGPEILPAIPLPTQVERETERNRQDMDTVSGSHEVSRAEVPSGVKSGIAINYLLEQDDTTIAPVIRSYERAKKYLAQMKLALAKEYYTSQRIIKNTGEDAIDVYTFTGTDLTTNVRIVPGSALPQSRAALQATYIDLFDRGAILDDTGRPDPKRLFDLLRNTMPVESMVEEEQLDKSRARRENILLVQGQEIIPSPWEDHIMHIKEHNKFRKTERFYMMDPQIKRSFDMHISIHIQLVSSPLRTGSAPGDQGLTAGGMGEGGGGGGGEDPSRISPSFMGQGSMGQLNNPPSNKGGTIPGG